MQIAVVPVYDNAPIVVTCLVCRYSDGAEKYLESA